MPKHAVRSKRSCRWKSQVPLWMRPQRFSSGSHSRPHALAPWHYLGGCQDHHVDRRRAALELEAASRQRGNVEPGP
jgi:hypothetical protein